MRWMLCCYVTSHWSKTSTFLPAVKRVTLHSDISLSGQASLPGSVNTNIITMLLQFQLPHIYTVRRYFSDLSTSFHLARGWMLELFSEDTPLYFNGMLSSASWCFLYSLSKVGRMRHILLKHKLQWPPLPLSLPYRALTCLNWNVLFHSI